MSQAEQALREGLSVMQDYLIEKGILPPDTPLDLKQTDDFPPVFSIDWNRKITGGENPGETVGQIAIRNLDKYPLRNTPANLTGETQWEIVKSARTCLLLGSPDNHSDTVMGRNETLYMKPCHAETYALDKPAPRSEMMQQDLMIPYTDGSGIRMFGFPTNEYENEPQLKASLLVQPELLNWSQPLLAIPRFDDYYQMASNRIEQLGYLPSYQQRGSWDDPQITSYRHPDPTFPRLQVEIDLNPQMVLFFRNPLKTNDIKTLCVLENQIEQIEAAGGRAVIDVKNPVHPLAHVLKLPDQIKGIQLQEDQKLAIRQGKTAILSNADGKPVLAVSLKNDNQTLSILSIKPKQQLIQLPLQGNIGTTTDSLKSVLKQPKNTPPAPKAKAFRVR